MRKISKKKPTASSPLTSNPFWMSNSIVDVWPSLAANCNGVPFRLLFTCFATSGSLSPYFDNKSATISSFPRKQLQ